MKSYFKIVGLFSLALAMPAQYARAGSPYFILGHHGSSVGTPGSAATANSYASVTLLRHQLPGQPAVQIAGPDPAYPQRIFPAVAGNAAYFATDAGSQWSTPLSAGWTVMAVLETAPGVHGWNGGAYSAAAATVAQSSDILKSRLALPNTYAAPIPGAVLDWASNTKIALKIGYFEDAGGLAHGLALYRRQTGVGDFQWLANLSQPTVGSQITYMDESVVAEGMYEYAVGVNYSWPGGQGAGALPSQAGIYSTHAKNISGPFMASQNQPTPTAVAAENNTMEMPPVAEGWLAFPNPAAGPALFISISPENKGNFKFRLFNLVGEKVLQAAGGVQGRQWTKVSLNISDLASGIYFAHLDIVGPDGLTRELPVQKVAIIH